MTDLEKLKELLTGFGVEFEELKGKQLYRKPKGYVYIRCHEGNEKVSGYCMFFTNFEFDDQGNFVEMGAWE